MNNSGSLYKEGDYDWNLRRGFQEFDETEQTGIRGVVTAPIEKQAIVEALNASPNNVVSLVSWKIQNLTENVAVSAFDQYEIDNMGCPGFREQLLTNIIEELGLILDVPANYQLSSSLHQLKNLLINLENRLMSANDNARESSDLIEQNALLIFSEYGKEGEEFQKALRNIHKAKIILELGLKKK